jgi:hypothetical protein
MRITVDRDANWQVYTATIPPSAEALGVVDRGGDKGALVQMLATGIYVQVNAGAVRSLPQRDVRAALGQAAMLPPSPNADAVHTYLRRHGLTGSQAARMMYLSDSRQVRKYTGGQSPRQMDLARWFALHAHQMLPPETLAEIEAAMEADALSQSGDGT